MSLPTLNLPGTIAVSFLIGCGLGLLTVTLVTYLRLWIGSTNPLLKVGLGTGIGYLVCNLPPLFTASPETQAAISALLCIGGICLTFQRSGKLIPATAPAAASGIPFLQALACFTALIWLDSAAFFIIQNTPALKAGTWGSDFHLWGNGLLHFGAALAAVALLRRRGLAFLLAIAFLALGAACLLLLDPNRALPASGFYPVGVSLYSVALVAYPSLLARATSDAPGPPGRVDLCDSGLVRLRNGNRDGPESGPRPACICGGGRSGRTAAGSDGSRSIPQTRTGRRCDGSHGGVGDLWRNRCESCRRPVTFRRRTRPPGLHRGRLH